MLILFVRAIILYIIVYVIIRLTGKRQVSELQPYDLVITLLIADLASEPAADMRIPLMYGIVPILALFLMQQLFSFLSLKSDRMRGFICGHPLIVISGGTVQEEVLRASRYTLNDLLEQLHEKDIFDIGQVQYAVLETNGELSVILKGQYQQPTYQDFNLTPPQADPPAILVLDGKLNEKALKRIKHSPDWLLSQLNKTGRRSFNEILLASLNNEGSMYIQDKKKYGGQSRTLKMGVNVFMNKNKVRSHALKSYIAVLITVLFLTFLFIYPRYFLKKMTGELIRTSKETIDLVQNEEWEKAVSNAQSMVKRFEESRDPLKLFINHEDIDELEEAVKSCLQLAKAEDSGQFLVELVFIISQSSYLESIETLTLFNLF